MTTLGEKLKHYRKALKLTQAELGSMLQVSQVTIANYERGERFPKQKTLLAIAKIFNVSLDTLLEPTFLKTSYPYPKDHRFNTDSLIQILLTEPLETAVTYSSSWKSSEDMDLINFYERIITPTLVKTGILWFEGKILVSEEHLISDKIRELVLFHANKEWDRHPVKPEKGKRWMGLCAPGEKHSLALLMNAQLLRLSGWHIFYLGTQVPFQDLAGIIKKYNPAVLGISITISENLEGLKMYLQQIKGIFGNNPAIILGGKGISPEALQALPDNLSVAHSLIDGVSLAEQQFLRNNS